ncbi:MAG TPA: MFS transporter [Blastocatellia bacterium]|nr:MFS transporter [Blastocatellia bacterium]
MPVPAMQKIEALAAATSAGTTHRRAAWLVVAASSVGLFLHFGSLLVNAFGVFLTTLCEEFHWSRTQVSLAFTLATLTAMLTMPLTGWLTDRYGARRPILICTTSFGVLYAALSLLTPQLWHLYVLFLLLGLVGPGTSAVPHASLISRWFTGRRGLALGVAMCGTAMGGVIWPTASQMLLERFGWRNAYAISGAAVLLIAVPLMLLFLKEPVTAARLSEQPAGEAHAAGLTRGEALRGSLLWLLLGAFFIIYASIQACMIHLVPMLKDRGMTPAGAAFAASLLGVAGMIGRLGTGYLLDLLPAERVPVLAFSVVAAGIFLLFAGVSGPGAYVAAMLIGFGYGSESATIPYLVSRYFGLRSFGEIYSYLFVTVPLGGAIGPVLMGAGFDRTGSYRLALLLCGIATIIAALMMLRLGSYPVFSSTQTGE